MTGRIPLKIKYTHNNLIRTACTLQVQGESPNDRNDRAIRTASKWYQSNEDGRTVTLVTNDRACKALAAKEGLACMTVHEYVRKNMPEHVDLLSAEQQELPDDGLGAGGAKPGEPFKYPEHLSVEELNSGLRDGRFKQGMLHVDRTSNLEAFVVTDGEGAAESKHRGSGADVRDVLVSGRLYMNRAMDMDRVVIEMLPVSEWQAPRSMIIEEEDEDEENAAKKQTTETTTAKPVDVALRRPTGKVVGILRRSWRQYCGSIEMPANPRETNVLFVPVCRQIPKIRIATKHALEYENKRIVVVIDEWDATSRHPRGHYIRTIGEVGNIEVESEVILLENDVCISEFPQKVYRCLPKVGPNGEWDPSPADVKGRVDFRTGYRVFSVDPPGCKDIDDALHVRDLKNGKFELGVHIADVTHFVAPNNACDEEARFRGTSVYLVQKRIDMLPSLLTTDLCSLVGQKERLAFSVVWLVDADANILDTRFHKSVIKSCAAMTYAKAMELIDDADDESDLARDLRLMREMTRKLRKRREDSGALVLASNEVIYMHVFFLRLHMCVCMCVYMCILFGHGLRYMDTCNMYAYTHTYMCLLAFTQAHIHAQHGHYIQMHT
jgi:exosome complex exonuclease DIS3/RRP44